MYENIITKIGSKVIDLVAVAKAGFSTTILCFGHCPHCNNTTSARIFTNGEEYILACPHCGFRARGARGTTYFNEWADLEITILEDIRSNTKIPLVKKSATARKNAVRLLYC